MQKKIIIFVLVAIVILSIGGLIYKKNIREQNVFDQMYYTRTSTHFDWWGTIRNYKGLFGNMKQLNSVSRDNEADFRNSGRFVESYRSESLNDGARLEITFYTDNQEEPAKVFITYYTNWQDFYDYSNSYTYKYDVKNKTLSYSSSDPDDIEKNFLYDIFLTDWFEANPNTRFSLENLGKLEIVDEIP